MRGSYEGTRSPGKAPTGPEAGASREGVSAALEGLNSGLNVRCFHVRIPLFWTGVSWGSRDEQTKSLRPIQPRLRPTESEVPSAPLTPRRCLT